MTARTAGSPLTPLSWSQDASCLSSSAPAQTDNKPPAHKFGISRVAYHDSGAPGACTVLFHAQKQSSTSVRHSNVAYNDWDQQSGVAVAVYRSLYCTGFVHKSTVVLGTVTGNSGVAYRWRCTRSPRGWLLGRCRGPSRSHWLSLAQG